MFKEEVAFERAHLQAMVAETGPEVQRVREMLDHPVANNAQRVLEYKTKAGKANFDFVHGAVRHLPQATEIGSKGYGVGMLQAESQAEAHFLDKSVLWRWLPNQQPEWYPYYVVGRKVLGREAQLLLHAAFTNDEMPRTQSTGLKRHPLELVRVYSKDLRDWEVQLSDQNGKVYNDDELSCSSFYPASGIFQLHSRAPRAYRLEQPGRKVVYTKKEKVAKRIKNKMGRSYHPYPRTMVDLGSSILSSLTDSEYTSLNVLEHVVDLALMHGKENEVSSLLEAKEAKAESAASFLNR
jgi:hypothetical protein